MNNYERGFITKCAEYGVDPDILIKEAGIRDALRLAGRVITSPKRLRDNLKRQVPVNDIEYSNTIHNMNRLTDYKKWIKRDTPELFDELKDWDDLIDAAKIKSNGPSPIKSFKWNKPVQSVFDTKQYTADEFRKLYPDKDYMFRMTNGGGVYNKNRPYWNAGVLDGIEDFAKRYNDGKGGILLEVRRLIDTPQGRRYGNAIYHEHTAKANKQYNLITRAKRNKLGRTSDNVHGDPNYEAVIDGRTMQDRSKVKYYRIYPTHDGKFVFRTDPGRLADNIESGGLRGDIVPSIDNPGSYDAAKEILKIYNQNDSVKRYNNFKKSIDGYIKNLDFNKFKSDDRWLYEEVKKLNFKRDLYGMIISILGGKVN